MPDSAGARRPYLQPLSRSWWLKHGFFLRYMLREATVLPLLFFCGCLLAGLYSLSQGESQYQSWLAFMAQPWVIALHALLLLASLYHAKTFFVEGEMFSWYGSRLVKAFAYFKKLHQKLA